MSRAFAVDLRGMVDLLARHLYSGPRVYLRELLQNGVDAVHARQLTDAEAPASIRLIARGDTLEVIDTGVGLSAAEADELLATIGRSSKRDELTGRTDYIGRFGIGMLAAFMVAETIEVVSRSASGSPPVRWRGRDDGTFVIEENPTDIGDISIGTRVRLHARPEAAHWMSTDTVTALATEYGELLPVDISVEVPVGHTVLPRRISRDHLPWQEEHPTPRAREQALVRYGESLFGFTPLGVIDLNVPEVGLTGVAFVLPAAVAPTGARHRVYVKRMLLGDRVDGLLPDWAFFVRAVVNADGLNPTASREQLHTDEVLVTAQERLAAGLRAWATTALSEDTAFRGRFLRTHHLSLRALAAGDDEMLDLVAKTLPYQTTDGELTLSEVGERSGEILYAPTTEAFRRVADVARAQGLVVVNAGYVYDADVLARLSGRSGWRVRQLRVEDLVRALAPLDPSRELATLDGVAAAQAVLADADVDVLIRTFLPEDTAAVLLRDAEAEHQRDLAAERELADAAWGDVLAAFARPTASRQLVLNDANPLVRRLLSADRGEVFRAGVRTIHLSAVMRSGEVLRAAEAAQLNDSLNVLLTAGLGAAPDETP